jgi:hypothetical protein
MRKQGDGVLVYFGYPRAHEDDAERAVRAGLRLIDAVGRLDIKSAKLQARVGIATGLMVVGDLIGEGSAQDQSVVGETPNLAAWPPPRDRAGDIDPNYRRSPKLARQNFRRSNRARQVCKDSPLEGDGFEPSVPQQIRSRFRESRVAWRFDRLATRNWKFESISLQQRVRCEPATRYPTRAPVGRKPGPALY